MGWDIYQVAVKIGFCCKILTKGPRSKSRAWAEKVDCIDKHFGPEMPIDIVGEDKAGTYGRVLVDDYPPYLDKWLKHRKRGLAIMPAHNYNEDYTHPNVIRYNGSAESFSLVGLALQAAYDRGPDEDWKDRL